MTDVEYALFHPSAKVERDLQPAHQLARAAIVGGRVRGNSQRQA
jgi:hypothetical protein